MHAHRLLSSSSPSFKKATDLVVRNSSHSKSYKRPGMNNQFQNQILSKIHIQLKKSTFLSVLQSLILQPVSMISLCTSHNLFTAWKTYKLIFTKSVWQVKIQTQNCHSLSQPSVQHFLLTFRNYNLIQIQQNYLKFLKESLNLKLGKFK